MAIHSAQALPLVFAVLTLIGSLSLTIVHGIARGKARELEEWNWGDKLIPMAFIAAVPFWALLFVGLSHGLGASVERLDDGTSRIAAQMFSWYQVPRLVCMGLTKCSAACLVHALTGHIAVWKKASLASLVITVLWTVAAPMVAVVGCTSDDANVGWSCHTMGPRWRAITISSACLNVLLVGLAFPIPWMLQILRWSDRLKVSTMFLCGLIVSIVDFWRYFAFAGFLEHGKPSSGIASTTVLDCVSVLASILTVALPAIKQIARGTFSSTGRGSHGRSDATQNQRESPYDSEAQASALQTSPKSSMDLPALPRPAHPPRTPRRSPSPELELDETYGSYALRGMPSSDSKVGILGTKEQG